MLEKTLENPLDFREIKLSILKEISPEYSLEELMLKLKLQYFGHLMPRTDSLEKTLMLGTLVFTFDASLVYHNLHPNNIIPLHK